MTHLEILALLDSATLAQMVLDTQSALAAANARGKAAEAQLAAVPREALRRTWQRDIHDDPADADAIEQWLDAEQQEVQP